MMLTAAALATALPGVLPNVPPSMLANGVNNALPLVPPSLAEIKSFLWAWAFTQPRLLAMITLLPVFNQQLIPSLLRYAIAGAFGLFAAPLVLSTFPTQEISAVTLLAVVVKEAFVGFVMGYFFAIPFWLFQAIGFFIDNQRGASIGATLDPLTGNDSSPLGEMFLQAFIVFLLTAGGLQLILGSLYDSYRLWPIFTWMPVLSEASVPLMLDQLDRLVRMAVVLASPVLIVMFMAEIGLALISRFVPQLQVFFIAMPVKCALAFMVLSMYIGTLLFRTEDIVVELHSVLPFLNDQWHRATN